VVGSRLAKAQKKWVKREELMFETGNSVPEYQYDLLVAVCATENRRLRMKWRTEKRSIEEVLEAIFV
ncbi:hypothetical protein PanWU01x14_209800, partial [Parasponia andersonii]